MVAEQDLIDRIVDVIRDLPEEEFIELANSYLGTEYTYDDITWDKE